MWDCVCWMELEGAGIRQMVPRGKDAPQSNEQEAILTLKLNYAVALLLMLETIIYRT